MMQTPDQTLPWLIDASALTPLEVAELRQAPQIRWLYDHLNDPQAEAVGPVLVTRCDVAQNIAEKLQADEERAWAISALESSVDFSTMTRHLLGLRYIHTQDGQRYHLRHADSRSLVALWSVLSAPQQRALLGPISHWHHLDRRQQKQTLQRAPSTPAATAQRASTPLRLSNPQLSALLEHCWPDQLMHTVIDRHPDASRGMPPWQRHAHAQQVCRWLRQHQEDRYPVQVETLRLTLLTPGTPDHDAAALANAIAQCHQNAVASCA